MNKAISILLSTLLIAAACSDEDKLRYEQMQKDYAALQEKDAAVVPDALEPDGEDLSAYSFAFEHQRYGVDAGGSVSIRYTLPEASSVEVLARDGWSAEVTTTSGTEGNIVVAAPDPASPCDIVATATAQDGRKTVVTLPLMVRDPYTDDTRTYVNAMGYYGFKPHLATAENFRKLADAGLKMITVETDGGEEDYMNQLNLAQQVGMKCVPVVWGFAERHSIYGDDYDGLDRIINQLKNHPATYAYHIYDEPSTRLIPTLKKQKEKIESLDPDHPVYINLCSDGSSTALGVYHYNEYIEAFIRDCGVKFISYDLYPCMDGDPTFPDDFVHYFWKCLDIVSNLTKQYGIPFWAFAASCWIDREQHKFAKPTVENLRLQVYSDLAYGAQVIEYFTIMQYGGTGLSPIMADGSWSESYDILKAFNLEMQNRGFVFDGCSVHKVRHTYVVPSWSQQYSNADLPPQIESLSTAGEALVSFIENRGNEYVTVANKSITEKMTLNAVFNDMVYTIDHDGVFTPQQPGSVSFELDQGDMLVIKFK